MTGEEAEAGSGGYRDESSYGRRAQQERRRYESVSQRSQAEAIAGEFDRGILVRHPQFGLGRIEEITPAGTMTKAIVRFRGWGKRR